MKKLPYIRAHFFEPSGFGRDEIRLGWFCFKSVDARYKLTFHGHTTGRPRLNSFFQGKRKETANAFFSKIEIAFFFGQPQSKRQEVFRTSSPGIRRLNSSREAIEARLRPSVIHQVNTRHTNIYTVIISLKSLVKRTWNWEGSIVQNRSRKPESSISSSCR